MIKNYIALEAKKNDRFYKLYVDPESPLGEIFDVLAEMQTFVINKMKENQPQKKDENEKEVSEEKL